MSVFGARCARCNDPLQVLRRGQLICDGCREDGLRRLWVEQLKLDDF